jgi:DNA polymerase III alpha subunit
MQWFPGSYYLELQRTGREGEQRYIEAAVALAAMAQCPVVATNDVRFLSRDDFEAHEVRVCINERRTLDDPRRSRNYSEQQYLRTPAEMAELFSDIPEAIANTRAIAIRCNLDLELGKPYLPNFPVPPGETVDAYFSRVSREGLDARLQRLLPASSFTGPAGRRGTGAGLQTLLRQAGVRTRRDHPDGLPRVLPDRDGIHPVGAQQRHSRRAGPWFGRRVHCRLRAGHYRS